MRKSIVVTLLLLMAATLFVGAVYAFNAEGYPIVDEPITLWEEGRLCSLIGATWDSLR